MHHRIHLSAAWVVVFLFTASVALAATEEQRCLAGLAKAQGNYQSCVQKALSKLHAGTATGDAFQRTSSRCRKIYNAKWTKLQALTGTTCDVQRWLDNGNGTVTDNLTGLVWQKTDDLGGLTDKDNTYGWTDGGDADLTDEDGTVFTDFLANLNTGVGFSGANGWRLPTVAELQTILLPELYPCGTSPCIDQTAFGPTDASSVYWSATSLGGFETAASLVSLTAGSTGSILKDSLIQARAVRGGL
jgi:hypothetical protein